MNLSMRRIFSMKVICAAILFGLFLPAISVAQQGTSTDQTQIVKKKDSPSTVQQSQDKKSDCMQNMPGMDQTQMSGMQMDENALVTMHPTTFIQEIVHHAGSGTSAEPNSTPTPMLMTKKRAWSLMFHANVFISDIQQSSPRGGDKFFSTNWFMGMAQREAGPGVFTV